MFSSVRGHLTRDLVDIIIFFFSFIHYFSVNTKKKKRIDICTPQTHYGSQYFSESTQQSLYTSLYFFCSFPGYTLLVWQFGESTAGVTPGWSFPPGKGTWWVEGGRFSDTQVLLNISLTARSLSSWEWIIHPHNPDFALLPYQATVWCRCNFPVTK